jgi:hypothetical protein
MAEGLGEKHAVLLGPLEDVVGQEELLVARGNRSSALEDDIVGAVDLDIYCQLSLGLCGRSDRSEHTFLAMQRESLEPRARMRWSMMTLRV